MPSKEFKIAYVEAGLLNSSPSQADLLKLYALAKIAQGEDIKSAPAPGTFDFAGKAKRNAWTSEIAAKTTPAQAETKYIEIVNEAKNKNGIKDESKLTAEEKQKLKAAKA